MTPSTLFYTLRSYVSTLALLTSPRAFSCNTKNITDVSFYKLLLRDSRNFSFLRTVSQPVLLIKTAVWLLVYLLIRSVPHFPKYTIRMEKKLSSHISDYAICLQLFAAFCNPNFFKMQRNDEFQLIIIYKSMTLA